MQWVSCKHSKKKKQGKKAIQTSSKTNRAKQIKDPDTEPN